MTDLNGFTLITITGPTGSGKSALAVEVARHLGCHIISADSRQIYRGLPIGTAAPTAAQLQAVPHHFVGCLDLHEYYSAARFEADVIRLLPELAAQSRHAVMCGGSMMYIDAVTRGIDELPEVSEEVRREAYALLHEGGIEAVRRELERIDPDCYAGIDRNNAKRMVHAIEITRQAGVPYSSLLTGAAKPRPWRAVNIALTMPREQLFERINRRVDAMIVQGLEDEARAVYNLRHLNSLNTVGYKEMFAIFDGTMDRATAIARMAKNTRVYAKKQLTWLKRRPEFMAVEAGDRAADTILSLL